MKRKGVAWMDRMGVIAAVRALQGDRSVVLTYHGVLPDAIAADEFLDHNFVSASLFERHVDYLCKHYTPVSLRMLVDCYLRGLRPPRRAVALTFDDGFANNYSVAFPILRRRGVPFTVFITTGMVGASGAQLWTERVKRAIYLCRDGSVSIEIAGRIERLELSTRDRRAAAARRTAQRLKALPLPARDAGIETVERTCGRAPLGSTDGERYDFLSWDQIREMASAGVEFGSHTVNHPILAAVDPPTLEYELTASKQAIEEQVGAECYAFAYPNGSPADYGAREKSALRAAGYRCALSLRGTLNRPQPDLFEIDRININRNHQESMFEAAVVGLLGHARRARHGLSVFQRADITFAGGTRT